ncbi:hypothetical protein OI25_7744 [Paraburkholderia fungorum]|jgi:hypothetical protein|uniref:DUF3022 domain-containing protein n=1 Tax=Paraburkholderia fungorum TaxID=134537 RepID=A0AAP5V0M4_9BURK|nr:DUF3022 domain-containing protein [Paraburkholderia fungorum]AJZ56601.1 hypothetical protein OI25_7744 [Paraburkholderia fungorum]MDT8843494.1 DUF3022 domain-containing protein [Paraburkholderia fungorum]PRZ45502.1 Protein of unknown function (DUF3022) [Paraburkholderia fungorum]
MKDIDLNQRVEEIELALSTLFESPKAPAISSYDDGETFFIQASWVIESHRDTTLDARCVLTVRFSEAQIQRYAQMDTAQRIHVRERLCQTVRNRLPSVGAEQPLKGDCAEDLQVDDRLLEFDDPTGSY